MVEELNRFNRQIGLFGKEGQEKIQSKRIAVVGAGGLGSHVIQQLAFLGVGKLAIIDSDTVQETDLNRLIGSLESDVNATKKVDVSKRLVNQINSRIKVDSVTEDLINEKSFSAIKQSNFVFGCVDNDAARLVLTELCSAYEIPYVDAASDINKGEGTEPPRYGGRVLVNNDKNGCLYCYSLISIEDARRGLMSPDDRKDEDAIYGVPKNLLQTGPAVVSINGVVASLAVTEFMVSVVNLRSPNRLMYYHGHRGIVTISGDKPNSDCYYCNYVRGRKEASGVDNYWKKK
jgi:hypothetical protein